MKLSNLFQKSVQPRKPLVVDYSRQQSLSYQKQNLLQIQEAKSQLGANSQGYRALRAISHVLESHRLWEQDPEIGANSIWLYTEGCQSALHILLEHQTAHITWLGSLNGTGSALLETGLRQSIQRGATAASVKPIWESHGFYQKMGFQDQGNGYWTKTLVESAEQLDPSELEDLLSAVEYEQEEVNNASYNDDSDAQKLEKDYRALEAVATVIKNNQIALDREDLMRDSIFLYNYREGGAHFAVAALQIWLENNVAHVKWLGSYGLPSGSGKALLLAGLQQAKQRGATTTQVESKWESEGFYHKMGYDVEDKGTFNPFTGSSLVKMSRKLEESNYNKIHEDFSKRGLYRYNYRGEKAEYNPDFFDLEDDSLEDEHGKPIATKDKLVPKPHLRHELNLTKNPNLVYRGMSNAEFQQIKKTGKIQSKGGYNLAGQEGLTYFSTDPNSAEFYAHAFAPWQHKANWDNPAWVVAVNKPDPSRVVKVPGTGAHEVGVTGSVDASEIQEIYRGTAVQYHPGVPDQIAPSAWLHWEKVPLSMLTSHSSELQEKWSKKYRRGNGLPDVVEEAVSADPVDWPSDLGWKVQFKRFRSLDPLLPSRQGKIYLMPFKNWQGTWFSLTGKDISKIKFMPTDVYEIPPDAQVGDMRLINQAHSTKNADEKAQLLSQYKDTMISYTDFLKNPNIFDMPEILADPLKVKNMNFRVTVLWDKNKKESILGILPKNIKESWTKKYKKSINCNAPKGFSQRAHCAARRKRRAGGTTTSKSVDHPIFRVWERAGIENGNPLVVEEKWSNSINCNAPVDFRECANRAETGIIYETTDQPLPTKVYHVSRKRNRGSILKLGLLPKTKEHTHILRKPGVFAFETLEQAQDWAWNWAHEAKEPMDIWEVNVRNSDDLQPDPSREMQEIYDCWVIYKPVPVTDLRLSAIQPIPQGFFYKTSNPKKLRYLQELGHLSEPNSIHKAIPQMKQSAFHPRSVSEAVKGDEISRLLGKADQRVKDWARQQQWVMATIAFPGISGDKLPNEQQVKYYQQKLIRGESLPPAVIGPDGKLIAGIDQAQAAASLSLKVLVWLPKSSPSISEAWTKKYKRSIDCSKPRGFSQRAHCAARRKRRAGGTTTSKSVNEANNTTLSSPVRDQLNAWMELDQQYEDPTKRKSLQAKVWPYIQKNLDAIMSDLGPCNDGDYPAAPFAAWLLVQHMDAFPQNQVTFYKQLAKAIPNHPKLQFLWDRAAVNAWIQKHATNPKYYHDGKPLPDPTINVRNPDMFRDAGIQSTSREQALQNAKQAGNKLLVAAVLATDAQTQPSFTQTQEKRECAEASGTTKSKSVSESRMDTLVESMLHNLQSQGLTEAEAVSYIDERLDENLRKWFKQKWVRFGPDGKIRGACARGKDSEGKPKCLPQKKAWALGKKKRATAARRKRREDPNPERRGKAKNVATKESVGGTTLGSLCTIKTNFPEADFWLVRRGDRKNVGKPTKEFSPYHIGIKVTDLEKLMPQYLYYMMMHLHNQGYWLSRSMGTTALVNIRTEDVKNIQLALTEHELKENSSCPHCGGHMVSHTLLNEKKDACYYKVKSRYKVWPSAYASGALVQCRKKGAKNWGNKGKKQ